MIQAVRVRVSVVRDVVRVRVHQIYAGHLTHPNRAASLNSLGTAYGTATWAVDAQAAKFLALVSDVFPSACVLEDRRRSGLLHVEGQYWIACDDS